MKFTSSFNGVTGFKWLHLLFAVIVLSISTGALVALFLWLLELITWFRWQHLWIIWLLPLAGIAIVFVYRNWGRNADQGNSLIIDEIHRPGGGVPARMTPLVLSATLLTHLFGGSAGREGTAVQMGGSLAGLLLKKYGAVSEYREVLLMCGIAAGFGAVFGTPLAGAIFSLEIISGTRHRYSAVVPCFLSAYMAHYFCLFLGIHHTNYLELMPAALPSAAFSFLQIDFRSLIRVIIAGIGFGLAARLFVVSAHTLKTLAGKLKPFYLAPILGGGLVIAISYLLGTFDYLGLGVTRPMAGGISIVNAFLPGGAHSWSWLWKLLLTVITVSSGFKGGEVTPLFFIGVTLGNTLAILMGLPVPLLAAAGFIAVFAGATKTPFACTLMGWELFGTQYMIYFAVACFMASWCSGDQSIYFPQGHKR